MIKKLGEKLANIETVEELIEKLPEDAKLIEEFAKYLRASEDRLLEAIEAAKTGDAATSPSGDLKGHIEWGTVLHRLQNPSDKQLALDKANPAKALVKKTLLHYAGPSKIISKIFGPESSTPYDGYVSAGGEIWCMDKYAQFDLDWIEVSFENYLDGEVSDYPFQTNPYHAEVPSSSLDDTISIAVIGDWGTGTYDTEYGLQGGNGPAAAVMAAVQNLKTDFVMHLGDVYYSGTGSDAESKKLKAPGEEQANLLDAWGSFPEKTCFTLNSNHEMYGKARGIMGTALGPNTPFSHQNRTTYFGLTFGKWVILGLDSAYCDKSYLYMDGTLLHKNILGELEDTQQMDFIQNTFDLDDKSVLAMTHHNPIKSAGSEVVSNLFSGINLNDSMRKCLDGRLPDVWYWGHQHIGVVYNDSTPLGSATKGRCVGHSAIPFGYAKELKESSCVEYFAGTNVGLGTKQVRNGFAAVTLKADGTVVSEIFYEINADGTPVQAWPNPSS